MLDFSDLVKCELKSEIQNLDNVLQLSGVKVKSEDLLTKCMILHTSNGLSENFGEKSEDSS